MIELSLDTVITGLANDSAFLLHQREATKVAMLDELAMIRRACERMDILNLRLGPYTKTVLAKIQICRTILDINGDNISTQKIMRINHYLNLMEVVVHKKLSYGARLDKFLDRKENDIIEAIKSNLLQLDLDQYEKIRNKLISFREDLIILTDKLTEEFQ